MGLWLVMWVLVVKLCVVPGGDLGILQGYLEMQFEKQTLRPGSSGPRIAGRNESRCL